MARIVIAEDTPIQQALIRGLVEPDHAVVAVASDGAEAVEAVRAHDPDVVVLDVNMPNVDGLVAAERILAYDDGVSVLLSTAMVSADVRRRAEELGVEGSLTKPYTKAELLESIDRAT